MSRCTCSPVPEIAFDLFLPNHHESEYCYRAGQRLVRVHAASICAETTPLSVKYAFLTKTSLLARCDSRSEGTQSTRKRNPCRRGRRRCGIRSRAGDNLRSTAGYYSGTVYPIVCRCRSISDLTSDRLQRRLREAPLDIGTSSRRFSLTAESG